MITSRKRFLEFEQFSIDVEERQLLRRGRPMQLTPKVFDLLLMLAENSGRTLDKDELLDKIWADSFVEEGSLNRNVSTLRKALGEDGHDPRYIKTVPKRGYRFDPPVREVIEDEETTIVERRTRYSLAIKEEVRSGRSRFAQRLLTWNSPVMIAAASLAVVAGIFWFAFNVPKTDANSLAAEQPRMTKDPEAAELYRKGRELWQNRSVDGLYQATQYLEQAIRRDPEFALAHAALADAYAFDAVNWRKAEATANEAIRLDPTLGQPYATIGFIRMFWDWRLSDAEVQFKQAILLDPDYATAHQWYALNLTARNQDGSALAEIRRALELEPRSAAINADLCQIYYFSRKMDLAIEQCKRTLENDAGFLSAHRTLYEAYSAKEMFDEAVIEFFILEDLTMTTPAHPDELRGYRSSVESGGVKALWTKLARTATSRYPPGALEAARNYARLGNRDETLKWLEIAAERREFELVFFVADPLFDPVADDPRYRALAARLN